MIYLFSYEKNQFQVNVHTQTEVVISSASILFDNPNARRGGEMRTLIIYES